MICLPLDQCMCALLQVGDSLCSGTKPASTQSCNTGTSCNFCKGQSCSGQGTCSSTKQACVCDSGYKVSLREHATPQDEALTCLQGLQEAVTSFHVVGVACT